MRNIHLIIILGLITNLSFGQQKMIVHNSGNVMYAKELTAIEKIKLDATYTKIKLNGVTNTLDIQKSLIEKITFNSVPNPDKIYIIYNGADNATIINPYSALGLTITATGGTVVGTGTTGIANLEYNILGTTTNGSLSLATDRDVNLVLNNVTLTNPSGAAFSITGTKITNLLLTPGTTNTLTDGSASTRNGTITTDGPIVINNSGSLIVNGIKKHGLNTSSTITVLNGTVTIPAALSDGFHSEGYIMSGGSATITATADGIDAGDANINISAGTINITANTNDVKGLKTGLGTITITGGSITSTTNGAQSKAISSKGNMSFSNASITTNIAGASVLVASGTGFNPSHATGIKSDGTITINSGTFNLHCLAAANGGKGISGAGAVTISGGTFAIDTAGIGANYTNSTGVADSFSTSCISSDVNVAISGGTFNMTSTGANGKGISSNAAVNISGTANVNITNSGAAGKGIKADTTAIFDGGTTTLTLSGATILNASGTGFNPSYPTGVKTIGLITINSGTINVTGTAAATGCKGISSDAGITQNGGSITTNIAGAGANYTNSTGVADSYAAASISSDNAVNIAGGSLNLTNSGADGKGISTNTNINVSGTPTIGITNSGASGKGMKADGNILFSGGTTTISNSGAVVLTASGAGFDPSYPTGIKATGTITVDSGSVSLTGTAAATGCKGLSGDGGIFVNGGTISVTHSANGATYTNTTGVLDSYATAALSSDTNITINSGNVTTNSSGTGGKGIKSDGTLNIGTVALSPTLNITTTGARFLVSGTNYTHPKTIACVGAIIINNGTNTLNSTDDGIHSDLSVTINGGTNIVNAISTVTAMGEGIEAPTVTITGGVNKVTASNDGINPTYGTVAGGTNSNDNSNLFISGGINIVTGKDALDSNGNITISGGITIANGVTSGPEEAIDYNGSFYMNGGTLIAAGSNSPMTLGMAAASTQVSMFIKSTAVLPLNSLFHIENAAGTEMVTYKPQNAVYYFHFSSPSLLNSTGYKVYFGGSYTGGSFVGGSTTWGLYQGGTYSTTGATLKSTFTSAAAPTKINNITF